MALLLMGKAVAVQCSKTACMFWKKTSLSPSDKIKFVIKKEFRFLEYILLWNSYCCYGQQLSKTTYFGDMSRSMFLHLCN